MIETLLDEIFARQRVDIESNVASFPVSWLFDPILVTVGILKPRPIFCTVRSGLWSPREER